MARNYGHIAAGLLFLAACADPAPRPAPTADIMVEPMPDAMPELLKAIEDAYRSGKYDRGLALVKRALELEQSNVSTYDRIGSVYYALGRYGEALSFWSRALPLEKDLERRAELQKSIADTRRSLGLPEEAPVAPPPATASTTKTPNGMDIPVLPKPPRVELPRADPAESAKLYKKGVRFYAQGEYLQATSAFMRALELDAGNAEARKALERLRSEPPK